MALPLIGLTGYLGAGKDSVAGILARGHGYLRRAFADALKREVYDRIGHLILRDEGQEVSFAAWMRFVEAHKYDAPASRFGWLRPVLQVWGTEYRRALCGQAYWLEALAPELGPGVVVSDVRYADEAQAITARGGVIWRVTRPGHAGDAHVSEQGALRIPAALVLANDGSLADLAARVGRALEATCART